jgi:uncharacterized protein (TIGR03435 family)
MARASLVFLICWTACGQTEATPRFEVASIKPANAVRPGGGIVTGHGRVTIVSETLKRCIMGAYGLGPNQISGGPAWLDSDRFEIAAKSERDQDGDQALMVMLRTLLAERFNLIVHREMRTEAALMLETARNGPKLEKAEDGAASTKNGRGLIDARAITMSRFAEVLSRQMDLPVVDNTGLKGAFNLKLEWAPQNEKTNSGPSVFTALQEQLGLRLESRKMPIEVLVIDHAEKPSEN